MTEATKTIIHDLTMLFMQKQNKSEMYDSPESIVKLYCEINSRIKAAYMEREGGAAFISRA